MCSVFYSHNILFYNVIYGNNEYDNMIKIMCSHLRFLSSGYPPGNRTIASLLNEQHRTPTPPAKWDDLLGGDGRLQRKYPNQNFQNNRSVVYAHFILVRLEYCKAKLSVKPSSLRQIGAGKKVIYILM